MAYATTYSALGGPDVLTVTEIPTPVADAGQVVIRVEAAGVNPIDGKLRSGIRPSAAIDAPRRVGADGAGIITAVGAGVDGLRPGDAVVFFGASGAYATEIALTADLVTPRPPSVSAAEGAGIGIPFGTAYQALRSLGVGAGDTLLVHGGSGSVGQAAVQFAVLWGASVIATTSEGRADAVRALGATPIAYGDGLAARVRTLAPGGVSVILDAAGTDDAIEASLELLDDRDRIATIVRGADAEGWGIRAFSGGSPNPLTAQQSAWRAEAVPMSVALLAAGALTVEIGASFALAEAAAAHESLEAGARGKIVIVP